MADPACEAAAALRCPGAFPIGCEVEVGTGGFCESVDTRGRHERIAPRLEIGRAPHLRIPGGNRDFVVVGVDTQ